MRGRILDCDIPHLGIRAGDRLEPCQSCPDVGKAFDDLRTYPIHATFWRRSRETAARHRNPLFSIPGVDVQTLQADVLHCIYLGCAQVYLAKTFWCLIRGNAWGVRASNTAEMEFVSCQRIRVALHAFYKRHPGDFTELDDFSIGTIGSHDHPCFRGKGAETKSVVHFVVEQLRLLRATLSADMRETCGYLLEAGEHLVSLDRIWNMCQTLTLPPGECQAAFVHALKHIRAAKRGGVPLMPKHHQLLHLAKRTGLCGHPRLYATWADESQNRLLAQVAGAAHASVWECRIFDSVTRWSR